MTPQPSLTIEKFQVSEITGMILVLHELMNILQPMIKKPIYNFTPTQPQEMHIGYDSELSIGHYRIYSQFKRIEKDKKGSYFELDLIQCEVLYNLFVKNRLWHPCAFYVIPLIHDNFEISQLYAKKERILDSTLWILVEDIIFLLNPQGINIQDFFNQLKQQRIKKIKIYIDNVLKSKSILQELLKSPRNYTYDPKEAIILLSKYEKILGDTGSIIEF